MAGNDDPSDPDLDEGGPVKNFLEHLEDFRWVLIKSAAVVGVCMLLCLFGANYVIGIIKWPMTQAHVSYPGTNYIAVIKYGTNQLGKFELTTEQQLALRLPAPSISPKMAWWGSWFSKTETNPTNQSPGQSQSPPAPANGGRFVLVQVEPVMMGTNQVLGWSVNTNADVAVDAQKMHINLINLNPAGGFFVAFQVAIYGGMLLAAPLVLFFVATFIFPALKINEKKPIFQALIIGGGLFMVGVSFCYFVLMPVALSASQMYSQWLGLGAYEWRAEDYISFVCKFMLGMGLGFELPVVILTLVKLGIVNYRQLRSMWRYMIVINLVLGAVLTTPEVITQVLMAVPLYMLYEITVWIAWYWEWRDKRRGLTS